MSTEFSATGTLIRGQKRCVKIWLYYFLLFWPPPFLSLSFLFRKLGEPFPDFLASLVVCGDQRGLWMWKTFNNYKAIVTGENFRVLFEPHCQVLCPVRSPMWAKISHCVPDLRTRYCNWSGVHFWAVWPLVAWFPIVPVQLHTFILSWRGLTRILAHLRTSPHHTCAGPAVGLQPARGWRDLIQHPELGTLRPCPAHPVMQAPALWFSLNPQDWENIRPSGFLKRKV